MVFYLVYFMRDVHDIVCSYSAINFICTCIYRLKAVRRYNARLVKQIQGMAAVPKGNSLLHVHVFQSQLLHVHVHVCSSCMEHLHVHEH